MTSGADFLRALGDAADGRTADAEALIATLVRLDQLNRRADVTYRCAHRCALARAYSTTAGIVVQIPRYKMSPARNAAESIAEARAKRTEDGDRRWRAHAFMLTDALNIALNCDHSTHLLLSAERVERDVQGRIGTVVVSQADHERPHEAGATSS